MKWKFLSIAVTVCWAFGSTADAAQISVNFTESTGHANQQLAPSAVAGGGLVTPAANWNNVAGQAGTQPALVDSDGNATGVTVTWAAEGTWGDGTANVDADAAVPNAQLLRGYLDENDGGADMDTTIDLTGITYGLYNVFLIGSTDTNGGTYHPATINGNLYPTTGDKSTYGTDPALDASRVWVAGNLSGGNVSITLPQRDGPTRGSIAGLQIVEIPEPTSIALGCMGVVMIAVGARRRR